MFTSERSDFFSRESEEVEINQATGQFLVKPDLFTPVCSERECTKYNPESAQNKESQLNL